MEPLLTYKTAAKILDCSPWKVQQLCLAGAIPIVKIGNETRIDPNDLRAYIADNKHFHIPENRRECKRSGSLATVEDIRAYR